MPITAQFLRDIMTEARPIIERQMDDAKLIAGFRTVVANNGGDWGALKALIKAHIEDENDETGEGKRVQKILEKADSSTAYADMLGLANMNEKNFSEKFDPETGEINDADRGQHVGRSDDEQRHEARVPGSLGRGESDDEGTQGQGAGAAGPDRGGRPVSGTLHREDEDRGSRHVGGEARHEVTPSDGGAIVAVKAQGRLANAESVEPPPSDLDFQPFASLTAREEKPLRPYCQNPDLCAGSGAKHCYRCTKAMGEVEAA